MIKTNQLIQKMNLIKTAANMNRMNLYTILLNFNQSRRKHQLREHPKTI